jgi:polar amino acid transport system substrate-binding protein
MKRLYSIFVLILIASLALSACAIPQATSVPEKTQAVVEKPTNTVEVPTNTPEIKPTNTTEVKSTKAPEPTQAPAPPSIVLPDLGGKTITVAVENAYQPFNSIDEATQQGVGWDYDAVAEICKRLNCKPEFKEAAWDGIFAAMAAGEFDMLADGVTYTEDRDQTVDYSIPYVNVIQMLLVRVDETATVDEIKADPKRLVGTQIGTTNEIVAKKNFAADQVKSFETFPASILALLSNDIDGVVIDNVSAIGYMKEYEGKMKIAGQLQSNEQLAFVFPPNSGLIWSINAAIESMIADGTLEAINKKWGLVQ